MGSGVVEPTTCSLILIEMPDFRLLLEREILFFGGKGGVGKTTIASAIALHAAKMGKRTLLVSSDPAHSTSDILEANLGGSPKSVTTDFWAMEIDPQMEADRYIDGVKDRIAESTAPRLAAEVERQIDIARVSPGAEEAALFERFTRIIKEERERFDLLVFDTAPTGQTLRLLSLPEQMATWIGGLVVQRKKVNSLGRMWRRVAGAAATGEVGADDPVLVALEERRARFERTRDVLTDAKRNAFVFVVTPERLPIWETERAVASLTKYGIPVGGIVVNRVLPTSADGEFLARRRVLQAQYLEWIDRAFEPLKRNRVFLRDSDVVGIAALLKLAADIEEDSNL